MRFFKLSPRSLKRPPRLDMLSGPLHNPIRIKSAPEQSEAVEGILQGYKDLKEQLKKRLRSVRTHCPCSVLTIQRAVPWLTLGLKAKIMLFHSASVFFTLSYFQFEIWLLSYM